MTSLFPKPDSASHLHTVIEQIKPDIILLDYQAIMVANFDEGIAWKTKYLGKKPINVPERFSTVE